MPSIRGFVLILAPLALSAAPGPVGVAPNYGRIPAYFEKNSGQAAPGALFTARGAGYSLTLEKNGATLSLSGPHGSAQVGLDLVKANSGTTVSAEDPLPGRSNYYIGNDPKRWITGVPQVGQVRYSNVYPGIDLVWHGNQQQLEYDLILGPGADPGKIRLRFHGADSATIADNGDLLLKVGGSELRQLLPAVWQQRGTTRIPVQASYVRLSGGEIGICIGEYDRSASLTIDPVLVYSTFLGGSYGDTANAIAVDSQGDAYITGCTGSADFPGTSGTGGSYVAKLSPDASSLLFVSYFGWAEGTACFAPINGLAVDSNGYAYVAGGSVYLTTVPVTTGVLKTSPSTNGNAFVLKFDPSGNLIYGTYLGGSTGADAANAITVDGSGNAYVAGQTSSTDFPTSSGSCSANVDAFVAILNATASALLGSTCIGGSSRDSAASISLDSNLDIYIAGTTASPNLPVTSGAFQTSLKGGSNGFVAELSPSLSISWLTYLGGSANDAIGQLALDSSGNVMVAGNTRSVDFPTTQGAYQTVAVPNSTYSWSGGFVTRLNPSGTALLYSTLMGSVDGIYGFAIDPSSGVAYLGGSTSMWAAPSELAATPGGFQGLPWILPFNSYSHSYIAELSADGSALTYAGILGGALQDSISAIARGGDGSLYLAGTTYSSDFPVTAGVYQPATEEKDRTSAFVTKVDIDSPVQCTLEFSPPNVEIPSIGGAASFNVVIPPGCPWEITPGFVSQEDWLTFTTPTRGVGPATVSFAVPALPIGASANLTAESQTFTVMQDAQAATCPAPGLDQTSLTFDAAGDGTQTINVTLPSTCTWSPVVSEGWITAARSPEPVSPSVAVTVAPNNFAARSGSVTIDGVAVPVSQAAGTCTATITGPASALPASGGISTIQITTSDLSCQWGIYSVPAWMQVGGYFGAYGTVGSPSGTGSGLVPFVVAPNQTASARSATLSVAGQSLSITQQAGPAGDITTFSEIGVVAGGGGAGLGDGGAATAASLLNPQGLGWYGGTLYIVDGDHDTIRSVTSDGLIHTVAGGGSGTATGPATSIGLTAPQAIAFKADGTMYIADQGSGLIWQVTPGGTASVFAGGGTSTADGVNPLAAQINVPSGVAVDGSGNVYIADTGGHRVREVSQSVITTVAGTGVCGFSGDGAAATAAQLCQPGGLAIDSTGNLYIADSGNQRVREVIVGAGISTFAGGGSSYPGNGGPAISAQLSYPWQLATDAGGNVYFTDPPQYAVRQVVAGTIGTIESSLNNIEGDINYDPGTSGVAVDNVGDVFVSGGGVVVEFTPNYLSQGAFCSLGAAAGAPSNPFPANGATGIALGSMLSWSATTGATSYDVYFGTANPPPLISSNVTCNLSEASEYLNTTYYWQIVAHTPGGTLSSRVWSFTTQPGYVYLQIFEPPSYGGTVTANPPSASGMYLAGTQVCLTATPSPGWYFAQWSDITYKNPNCLNLYTNQSETAYFTQQTYTLSLGVSPSGAGTIAANPPPTNGIYPSGVPVCLTAKPNPGWQFTSWTGGYRGNPYCFQLYGNISVTANFSRILPAISGLSPASAAPGGTAFTLTVNGTNFVSGDTTVLWNGVGLSTTFVSATQLTATVTPDLIASAGMATITVMNTGGAASPGVGFPIRSGPAAALVSPGGGTGAGQTFTFTFSDPSGWQNLGVMDILVNRYLNGHQACYIAYSVPYQTLYLVDDAGDAGGPFAGSFTLPGTGTVSNSQCTVNGTGSSAVGSGNTLTLTLNIGFNSGFAGNKVIYTAARDTGTGNSGWQALGTWGAPGAATTVTEAMAVSPMNGSGASQTYTFMFSDSNGWQDLGVVDMLMNNFINGRNACYIAYSVPYQTLYLVDDAGDAGGPFAGTMVLPGTGTISNDQCTVNGTGSSAVGSGNTLTLTLDVSFTGTFMGNRIFYTAARDTGTGNSGWQALGAWAVP